MAYKRQRDVRIVVAFADITGFSAFMRQSHPSSFLAFYRQWIGRMEEFGRRYWVKDLGDEMMAIEILGKSKGTDRVLQFLYTLWDFQMAVTCDINSVDYPRPEGCRVSIGAGHAWEFIKRTSVDYLAPCINHAKKVNNAKLGDFIVDGTVKDLIPSKTIKKEGLSFDHLVRVPPLPGTPEENTRDLYRFSRGS